MTDVTPELRAQMRASLVNSDDTRTLCGVRFVDLLDALDATYCAYCGHRVERDDAAATKISSHIATCPRHPMRAVEAERDAALARIAEMTRERASGGAFVDNTMALLDASEGSLARAHDEIAKLRARVALLEALEAAGVDNWEGYGEALRSAEEKDDE